MEYINSIFGSFDKLDNPAFKRNGGCLNLRKNSSQQKKDFSGEKFSVQAIISNILEIHEGPLVENWGQKLKQVCFIGVIGKTKNQIYFSNESYIFQIGAGLQVNSLAHIQPGRLDHIFAFKWNYLLLRNIASSPLPVIIKIQSFAELKQMLYFWEFSLLQQLTNKKALQTSVSNNRVTVYTAKQGFWVQLNQKSKFKPEVDSVDSTKSDIKADLQKGQENKTCADQPNYDSLEENQEDKMEVLLQNSFDQSSQDQFELFFRIDRFQGVQQEDERRLESGKLLQKNQISFRSIRPRSKSFCLQYSKSQEQLCSTDGGQSIDEIY